MLIFLVHDGAATLPTNTQPHMRFLNYVQIGGFLPAHIDLSKTDGKGRVSTHTSILYVRDCGEGGETALLRSLTPTAAAADAMPAARDLMFPLPVTPRRGRLLFFPHACPHEGRACASVPKLLLRGELY